MIRRENQPQIPDFQVMRAYKNVLKAFALSACLSTSLISNSFADNSHTAPEVVASIKPVHSLVSAIMNGVGEPALIVDGAASPHGYWLKPSQAKALEEADLVFWIGEELESFLQKPLETIADKANNIALIDVEAMNLRDKRENDQFARHSHDHDHDDHDHARKDDHEGHDHHKADPHIWLDPQNAIIMGKAITAALAKADPANDQKYQANYENLNGRLEALSAKLKVYFESVSDKQFLVFHDAYAYFETGAGLEAIGSVVISPETPPSARRLEELRKRVQEHNVVCIFSEPQFSSRVIEPVKEGTGAMVATLDPLGATLENGPDLYFGMVENLAANFKDCLSGSTN